MLDLSDGQHRRASASVREDVLLLTHLLTFSNVASGSWQHGLHLLQYGSAITSARSVRLPGNLLSTHVPGDLVGLIDSCAFCGTGDHESSCTCDDLVPAYFVISEMLSQPSFQALNNGDDRPFCIAVSSELTKALDSMSIRSRLALACADHKTRGLWAHVADVCVAIATGIGSFGVSNEDASWLIAGLVWEATSRAYRHLRGYASKFSGLAAEALALAGPSGLPARASMLLVCAGNGTDGSATALEAACQMARQCSSVVRSVSSQSTSMDEDDAQATAAVCAPHQATLLQIGHVIAGFYTAATAEGLHHIIMCHAPAQATLAGLGVYQDQSEDCTIELQLEALFASLGGAAGSEALQLWTSAGGIALLLEAAAVCVDDTTKASCLTAAVRACMLASALVMPLPQGDRALMARSGVESLSTAPTSLFAELDALVSPLRLPWEVQSSGPVTPATTVADWHCNAQLLGAFYQRLAGAASSDLVSSATERAAVFARSGDRQGLNEMLASLLCDCAEGPSSCGFSDCLASLLPLPLRRRFAAAFLRGVVAAVVAPSGDVIPIRLRSVADDVDGGSQRSIAAVLAAGQLPPSSAHHESTASTPSSFAGSPDGAFHYQRLTANTWLPAPLRAASAILAAASATSDRDDLVPATGTEDLEATFRRLVAREVLPTYSLAAVVAALGQSSHIVPPSGLPSSESGLGTVPLAAWHHSLSCVPLLWDLAVPHGGVARDQDAPSSPSHSGNRVLRRALRRAAHLTDHQVSTFVTSLAPSLAAVPVRAAHGGHVTSERARALEGSISVLDVAAAAGSLLPLLGSDSADGAEELHDALQEAIDRVAAVLWRAHAVDIASGVVLPRSDLALAAGLQKLESGMLPARPWRALLTSAAELCVNSVLPLLGLLASEPSQLDRDALDACASALRLIAAAAPFLGVPHTALLPPSHMPRAQLARIVEYDSRDAALASAFLATPHSNVQREGVPTWLIRQGFHALLLDAIGQGAIHAPPLPCQRVPVRVTLEASRPRSAPRTVRASSSSDAAIVPPVALHSSRPRLREVVPVLAPAPRPVPKQPSDAVGEEKGRRLVRVESQRSRAPRHQEPAPKPAKRPSSVAVSAISAGSRAEVAAIRSQVPAVTSGAVVASQSVTPGVAAAPVQPITSTVRAATAGYAPAALLSPVRTRVQLPMRAAPRAPDPAASLSIAHGAMHLSPPFVRHSLGTQTDAQLLALANHEHGTNETDANVTAAVPALTPIFGLAASYTAVEGVPDAASALARPAAQSRHYPHWDAAGLASPVALPPERGAGLLDTSLLSPRGQDATSSAGYASHDQPPSVLPQGLRAVDIVADMLAGRRGMLEHVMAAAAQARLAFTASAVAIAAPHSATPVLHRTGSEAEVAARLVPASIFTSDAATATPASTAPVTPAHEARLSLSELRRRARGVLEQSEAPGPCECAAIAPPPPQAVVPRPEAGVHAAAAVGMAAAASGAPPLGSPPGFGPSQQRPGSLRGPSRPDSPSPLGGSLGRSPRHSATEAVETGREFMTPLRPQAAADSGASLAAGIGAWRSPVDTLAALTSERGHRLRSLRSQLDAVIEVAHFRPQTPGER